jgi:hypothetical protein
MRQSCATPKAFRRAQNQPRKRKSSRSASDGVERNALSRAKSADCNFQAVIQHAALQRGFLTQGDLPPAQILSKYNVKLDDSAANSVQLCPLCGAIINSR